MNVASRLRGKAVSEAETIGSAMADLRAEAKFLAERLPEFAARLDRLPPPDASPAFQPRLGPQGAVEAGVKWRSRGLRRLIASYIWLWESAPALRPMLSVARGVSAPVARLVELVRHGPATGSRRPGRWRSGAALAAISFYERLWNAHPASRGLLHAARRTAAPIFRVMEFITPGR